MAAADRHGFTLVELLVVIAMIAIIIGALTTSVSAAMQRAKIQRATSDVRVISQAILGYENFAPDEDLSRYDGAEVTLDNLAFLFGGENDNIPPTLQASLKGMAFKDPWGETYTISIVKKDEDVELFAFDGNSAVYTGIYMPNFVGFSGEGRE